MSHDLTPQISSCMIYCVVSVIEETRVTATQEEMSAETNFLVLTFETITWSNLNEINEIKKTSILKTCFIVFIQMLLETNSKRKSVPTKPQSKMISLITLVHMFIVFDKRNGFGFSSELGEYFFLLQIISLDIVVIFWLL